VRQKPVLLSKHAIARKRECLLLGRPGIEPQLSPELDLCNEDVRREDSGYANVGSPVSSKKVLIKPWALCLINGQTILATGGNGH